MQCYLEVLLVDEVNEAKEDELALVDPVLEGRGVGDLLGQVGVEVASVSHTQQTLQVY